MQRILDKRSPSEIEKPDFLSDMTFYPICLGINVVRKVRVFFEFKANFCDLLYTCTAALYTLH